MNSSHPKLSYSQRKQAFKSQSEAVGRKAFALKLAPICTKVNSETQKRSPKEAIEKYKSFFTRGSHTMNMYKESGKDLRYLFVSNKKI